jgi:hypothetical protein
VTAGIEFESALSSKIKGRGTSARLRFCLHISFRGAEL